MKTVIVWCPIWNLKKNKKYDFFPISKKKTVAGYDIIIFFPEISKKITIDNHRKEQLELHLAKWWDVIIPLHKKASKGQSANHNYQAIYNWINLKEVLWDKLHSANDIRNQYSDWINEYLHHVVKVELQYWKKIFTTANKDEVIWFQYTNDNWWTEYYIPPLKYNELDHMDTNKKSNIFSNRHKNLIWIIKTLKWNQIESPKRIEDTNFILPWEEIITKNIDKIIKDIESKSKELSEEEEKLNDIRKLKGLLYQSWTKLDDITKVAFEILWYKIDDYSDENTDIDFILESPDSDWMIYVWECEGKKNKSVDKNKHQKLETKFYDYDEHYWKYPNKWILVWNVQFDIKPTERTIDVFWLWCIRWAESRKNALISSVELFEICKRILELPKKEWNTLSKKIREHIKSNIWVISFQKIK